MPPVPVAHPARTVIGPDDPAAVMMIIGIVIRIVAAVEEAAMMMEAHEAMSAVMAEVAIAIAAEMRDPCAVPSSAAKTRATVVTADVATSEMTAAAEMSTATEMSAASMPATAVAATHRNRQIICRRLCRRR